MKRKGQEEMVGFVLIIVLVTVIALVFLSISLKKSPEKLPSNEISSFLQSVSRVSTSCYLQENQQDIRDLAIACSNNEECGNGLASCNVLNKTLYDSIKLAWRAGERVNGARLEVYEEDNNRSLVLIKQGNMTGQNTGDFIPIISQGNEIRIYLDIYS